MFSFLLAVLHVQRSTGIVKAHAKVAAYSLLQRLMAGD
jgi:hypothetical protein